MSAATARRCAGRLASPRRASHRAFITVSRPHIRPWMRVPTDGWLLRDFLREALYNRDDGYFANASSPPVGAMSRPIPFQALLGQEDYARTLARRYDALASQWLTPVEIFKPHYARAVARYILRAHKAELDASLDDDDERRRRRVGKTSPLRIYELGGGTGTCAAGILAHIRDDDPTVFASTEYVGVEISPTLAKMQRETVRRELGDDVNIVIAGGGNGGGDGRGNGGRATYSVERRDALDAGRWGPVDDAACFVVALEVLDNLPHDRVMLLRDDARIDETKMGSAAVVATRVSRRSWRRRGYSRDDAGMITRWTGSSNARSRCWIRSSLALSSHRRRRRKPFGFTVKRGGGSLDPRRARLERAVRAHRCPGAARDAARETAAAQAHRRGFRFASERSPRCLLFFVLALFIWFLVFFAWLSSFGFLHLAFVWFFLVG